MALVSIDDVRDASASLPSQIIRTPLVPFAAADAGRPLWLKAESLQATGAFKMRGAYNTIQKIVAAGPINGVVAQSSGNHGRAVSHAAHQLGLKASIVMPTVAPEGKIAAIRALGAEVILVQPLEREAVVTKLVDELGYVAIPPFDHPDVIAGQGTVGLELLEDGPHFDV